MAVRSRFSGSMTIPARRPVYGASGREGLEITAMLVKPVPDMPSQLAARTG
ncbi:hypothetical protein [Escherichia coli]|uniref:hypothetical protein n=1 Tax=Escherichia coli TaxID=562 RepID=UPI00398077CD